MELEKKSFIVYTDYEELFKLLPHEEIGKLILAIFAYEKRREIPANLGDVANAVFVMVRQDLDINRNKYKNRCEANRANGAKGGRPRKEKTENDISIKSDSSDDTHEDKNATLRKSIVDYLNKKAGTRYRPSGSKAKTSIDARIAEGFTEDDFRCVIDKKCAEWSGTEWEGYLRPETIFGTKFEGYLNAPQRKPKENSPADGNSFETDDAFFAALERTYSIDREYPVGKS